MKRLLVIEDDEPIADLLERGLRLAGYEVEVETDGQAGLERWARGGLAAIILDVMLPGANGVDIAAERRAAGDRTPVLLLTARDDAVVRTQASEVGIDALMVKPFVYAELVDRLAALTRRDVESVSGPADGLDG